MLGAIPSRTPAFVMARIAALMLCLGCEKLGHKTVAPCLVVNQGKLLSLS
jgi:hypothetical protein